MKFAVNAAEGREAENYLSLLYDLAQILTSTADVQNSLDQVLMLLAERLHMMQGTITLVSPQTGEIRIESSYGLKPAERSRGRYVQGEGIIGRVVQTGQPMYISNVSEEPLFLNRTRSRDLSHSDISYICVPIRLNQQVVGALSVDRLLTDQVKLEEEQQLMTIIATLLGYAAWETQRKMDEENVPSKRPKGFVGNSDVMQHVYAQIMQVAQSPTTVFLQGESGTGKELAARAIHAASARAERPFVSLNCAALPESLIESELFGHEKGAFTGATSMRKGRFEQADGGTLFLDEVGELSMMTQAKLLRVLQERSFERLGGMETIRVDVRVITATNRNLEKMVAEGTFRRDLFYRLNVFPIVLPPLRDRQDDILPLASHFVGHFARQAGKGDVRISLAAMDMLQRYSWPGNIRELETPWNGPSSLWAPRISSCRSTCRRPCTRKALNMADEKQRKMPHMAATLEQRMDELERACIVDAMEATGGQINRAAQQLGLTQRVLALRLKKYGLSYKEYRRSGREQAGK